VGAVLESTRGVTEAQRSLLQSWSRDQGVNAPLSRGMVAASPRHPYGYSPSAGRSADMRQRKGGAPRIATFSADADDHDVTGRPLGNHLSQIAEANVEDSDEDGKDDNDAALYGFYHHQEPQHTATPGLFSEKSVDELGMRKLSVTNMKDSTAVPANSRIDTFSGSDADITAARQSSTASEIEMTALRQPSAASEVLGDPAERAQILHEFYGIPLFSNSEEADAEENFAAAPAALLSRSQSQSQSSPQKGSPQRPTFRAALSAGSAAQLFRNTIAALTIDVRPPQEILGQESNSGKMGRPVSMSSTAAAAPSFAISPTPRARKLSLRNQVIASGYARPHGIPNLELNMADIVPVIDFLDGWLAEMEQNEWTYDYHNPKYAFLH
jgi:hypothetical protein